MLIFLVATAAVIWWLNSPAPVEVLEARQIEEAVIEAEVASCGGALEVDVSEDDRLVAIRVLDHRFRIRLHGDDCADVVHAELSGSLGGRTLVDGTTARQLIVP